jgi:hypothetical protein
MTNHKFWDGEISSDAWRTLVPFAPNRLIIYKYSGHSVSLISKPIKTERQSGSGKPRLKKKAWPLKWTRVHYRHMHPWPLCSAAASLAIRSPSPTATHRAMPCVGLAYRSSVAWDTLLNSFVRWSWECNAVKLQFLADSTQLVKEIWGDGALSCVPQRQYLIQMF